MHRSVNLYERISQFHHISNCSKHLKIHPCIYKKTIVISIIITFIQRILLFSITYVIYKSFRFNTLNYFEILLLQIFVQIACEGIILPGGVGVSEFISKYLFKTCFGVYFTAAMVICRTLSFYFPLIILLFIILIVTKKYYFQK